MVNSKKNDGKSLIKIILLILFTILVVFFAYELTRVDILDVKESELNNKIEIVKDWAENLIRENRR